MDFRILILGEVLDMDEVKRLGFFELASSLLRNTAGNATGKTFTPCQSFGQLVDTLLEHCPDAQLAIGNTGLSAVSTSRLAPKADLQLLCRALAMLNRCGIFLAHITDIFF